MENGEGSGIDRCEREEKGEGKAYSSCIDETTSFVKAGEDAVTPHLSATLSIVAIPRIGICVRWELARGTNVAVRLERRGVVLTNLVNTPRFNALKARIGAVYAEERTRAFGPPLG